MDSQQFHQAIAEKNMLLDEVKMNQFKIYMRLLQEWNEKINLTALIEEHDIYLKHFYDSLTAAFVGVDLEQHHSLIDIGAGAGFPSLPLKICFPHLQLTLVDSLKKRTHFLQHLVDVLSLDDVHIIHERAENVGQDKEHRQQYDICVARAVAKLNVLSEYCLPLVRIQGYFIALKGPSLQEELPASEKALRVLGGKIFSVEQLTLPETNESREIIVLIKDKITPGTYPRKAGIPVKQPLT